MTKNTESSQHIITFQTVYDKIPIITDIHYFRTSGMAAESSQ